jgi:pimeloyl-ACP methyl ester carboxylesterase
MSQKPVLYLLPGLLCDARIFRTQVDDLAPVCEVRVPDFFGFDSLTAMAEHVLASAPARFSVAGFSMGGRVAFEIMRLAPERIERFCAFDTGVHPLAPGELEKREAIIRLAYDKGMEGLANAWLPGMIHPARRTDAAFMQPLREMILSTTPEIHEKQIRALINRRDATPVLAQIHCPAMFLAGRQDEWSQPKDHEAMAQAVPFSRFVVIEDSGHFVSVEQPAAFTKALCEWMELPTPAA